MHEYEKKRRYMKYVVSESKAHENQRGGFQRVIPCTGKNTSVTWCCGDNDDCCTSEDQTNLVSLSATFTIAAVASTSPTSIGVSSTSSTEASSINSASTNPTSTAATASIGTPTDAANVSQETVADTGLSTGAKAGIAIGAVSGAVLLVAFGVWIAKAMAWRRDAHAAKAHNNPGFYTPGSDAEGLYGQYPQKYAYYAEADSTSLAAEIPAAPDPVEAPDTQVDPHNSRLGGFLGRRQ